MTTFTDRKINWDAVKDFSPINQRLKQHLVRVYSTLAATLAMSAIGAWAHVAYNLGGLISFFATIGLIAMLHLTPAFDENVPKRTLFLFGIGFFQGCSIGPLLAYTLELDPLILVNAFVGTFAIFGCFSASALFAQRRSMLYLGAFLSSGLSLLFWVSIANIFLGTALLSNVTLYLGLLVFCGFVMFDTQLVIEKFHMGNQDYLAHSLELFLDFINIFVRLVVILSKDKKKNSRK
ncbi:Bax inhibitor 1, putative [Acanthamoeba castellanii str. Neff]|uniref:Bax inhibitor 1, putative n=1 Tax=Acanthamoeba castellanii (strain ATCC 30010 / Neff) TaxID=1257118 RepID=L8HG39_ACACF|nr:Bax inhibitor 1, putative [Acanthamoeba castellanii str. Neff]ELR23693.1 Bax inhibitor 1, putative [Acanthamoeba castellanii str. Neff]